MKIFKVNKKSLTIKEKNKTFLFIECLEKVN